MLRFLNNKKPSREALQRLCDQWMQTARERGEVISNALMYNAGLHKALQHELCVCQHGASKHLQISTFVPAEIGEGGGFIAHTRTDGDGTRCREIGCNCEGFKSNWQQSFENWSAECWSYLDRSHNRPQHLPHSAEDPMHQVFLAEAFDSGVKAEDQAKKAADWLTAMDENAAEATNGQQA